MGVVGSRLRSKRESRGLNRAQVARATSIYAHHLAALEHGDFGGLPDDATVEGYVRTYADYLGLDATEIATAFQRERESRRPKPVRKPETGALERKGEVPRVRQAASEGQTQSLSHTGDQRCSTERDTLRETSEHARPVAWIPRSAAAVAVVVAVAALVWVLLGRGRAPEPAPETASSATGVTATGPSGGSSGSLSAAAPETFGEVQVPDGVPTASDAASTPIQASPPRPPDRGGADAAPPTDEIVRVDDAARPEPARVPQSASGSTPIVLAHGVGTGVVDHRLVGESDAFSAGSKVWYWTRVLEGGGQTIYHVWVHEGRVTDRIPLTVESGDWRTQSRKTLYRGLEGRWTVEARDGEGNLLASREFLSAAAR